MCSDEVDAFANTEADVQQRLFILAVDATLGNVNTLLRFDYARVFEFQLLILG